MDEFIRDRLRTGVIRERLAAVANSKSAVFQKRDRLVRIGWIVGQSRLGRFRFLALSVITAG
jgi:hypothetical protein